MKEEDKNESIKAYENAQKMLKEWEEGYVGYDMTLTSIKQVKQIFPNFISGDILNMIGNRFYWKRHAGHPLILYAKNPDSDSLKDKGMVELCRINISDTWIGFGHFRIAWPRSQKEDSPTTILIALYLCSTDNTIFETFVMEERKTGAFLSCLFLDEENAENFNQLAEQRFESLR